MKKVTFNKFEIQAYIEEMIQMDLATDSELAAYEQLMARNTMNAKTYATIIEKMTEMFDEKF